MPEPTIARRKPYLETVKRGKTYFWCRCGRSAKQPFCDGSHRGTEFTPVAWVAKDDGEVLFCGCKHTGSAPLCDGSHNSLSGQYQQAEDDGGEARVVAFEPDEKGVLRARLDGDCYVIRVPDEALEAHGNIRLHPVIGTPDNARFLSQLTARIDPGESPVLRFPGSDTALYVISGQGRVNIGGREFSIGPESGACIKAGEAFSIVNPESDPIALNLSVCPPCAEPEWLDRMPDSFDEAFANRVERVDEARREKMADRFFQVLIDHKSHGTEVTQFIGEIPRSRAAHHRHLYEETLTVLSGEGFMWTDETKAPVRPGDTIFLPLKQHHSLECTTESGMRLVGVFYPSGSPAINY